MIMTTAEYTGGNSGWGDMIYRCAECGEIIARYECDKDGLPQKVVFDNEETHRCPEEE